MGMTTVVALAMPGSWLAPRARKQSCHRYPRNGCRTASILNSAGNLDFWFAGARYLRLPYIRSCTALPYGPTVRTLPYERYLTALPCGPTVRTLPCRKLPYGRYRVENHRTDATVPKTTVRTLPCRKLPYGRCRTENYRTDAAVPKTTVRTLPCRKLPYGRYRPVGRGIAIPLLSGLQGYCNAAPFGAPRVLQYLSLRGSRGIAKPLVSGLRVLVPRARWGVSLLFLFRFLLERRRGGTVLGPLVVFSAWRLAQRLRVKGVW